MMIRTVTIILSFLFTILVSYAQDTIQSSSSPSSVPTSVATSAVSSPSFPPNPNPSILVIPLTSEPTSASSPTTGVSSFEPSSSAIFTFSPTVHECTNTPDWYYEFWDYGCYRTVNLTCDNDLVNCWDYGQVGFASNHCCKCKSQCLGKCNINDAVPFPSCDDPRFDINGNYKKNGEFASREDMIFILIGFIVFIGTACALGRYQMQQGDRTARRQTRETMAARRRQQRENNSHGLTEEERNHARYELFLSKFRFQTVLPDKSNISATSLRSTQFKADEEHQEGPDTSALDFGTSDRSGGSRHISSWRKPSAKDECCICLESYNVGETICAAITKECDHVFHEGCMLQWFKNNDMCPLCRVDLKKD